MRALEASLSEVLGRPGAVGAALVDAVTGLSFRSAGEHRLLGSGAELAELVDLIGARLHEAGAEGELESLVVTSTRRYEIVQVVPRQGDPLLLATVLDRERVNLALAIQWTADRAKEVLR
ncbi:hypothetical protein OG196_01910 [Kitasatospora purpeofusca]|uniref:hypothetical protein n=1 Tax=Kitasatospora purpeofusca TaxID=67352 RepID=UPI002E10151C|nr:hypothetical protein OG715_01355 [Kitasatospora purpeofusca]WSR37937.1 hypothetical protein OG196_01910 [Kitasatospora purpeofusca]